jgi:hypothetical protein
MRAPLALVLTLLATAGLLSSCGKGQPSASTRTVTVRATTRSSGGSSKAPSGGSTQERTARGRALAFARAVNLRAGDLPGFQSAPRESERSTPTQKRQNRELQHCVGAGLGSGAGPDPLAELSSESFQRKASIAQVSVSSSVTVHRSGASAHKELEAIQNPHTHTCFTHYFEGLFTGPAYKGATIGHVSLESGTPPAPGTSGSFGWRLRASLEVHSVHIPFDFDILGFFYGQSEVTLMSTGVAVPFPAATEQQLFLLLLSRAKAQHLQ